MGKAANDLDAKLDALYASPLAEFVNVRNALAKSLEASGRKEDAARVKALRKPTPAAWAVNQLALSAPRLFAALVASGDRLRANPPDVKDAMQRRRDALSEARREAERALAGAGHAANPDVMRRVSATLEAIATYGSSGGPAAGRLTEDVPAPGFDEVASLGFLGGAARAARRTVSTSSLPAKAPREPPKIPSTKNLACERALEEKRRRDDAKRAAALKKDAQVARTRLAACEKATLAARRRKASLEASLAEAAAEEKKREAELAAARKASQAADAAASER